MTLSWDVRQAYMRQAMDTARVLTHSCDAAQLGEAFDSKVLEQLDLMISAARKYDEAVAADEHG